MFLYYTTDFREYFKGHPKQNHNVIFLCFLWHGKWQTADTFIYTAKPNDNLKANSTATSVTESWKQT